ncbi:putative BAP31 domain protein [Microthyrium microscopicum]|uniref:Endoplasmic reticulum transmembrane protein n=1 Tax=Microthyrium microscopicum TaxID=703497 RepID=A0A6A6U8N0_9PEZI|nr:putative BAP31 domain protein [Microthyrium microscopicum]
MTLYYTLVFFLLMAEMAVFLTLVLPMPFAVRRRLFVFLSENPIIAKIQYGLKITFIFILILFVDSVNRVYRVQLEVSNANNDGRGSAAETLGGGVRAEVQARKFYAQRNMYLCGFTLFLSLILNRTYVMILDTLRLEEEVKRMKGDSAAGGKTGKQLASAGEPGEIARLKKELQAARSDLSSMKSQSEGLQREYNRLGDEKSPVDGVVKKDR